jgi:hypothetical protein
LRWGGGGIGLVEDGVGMGLDLSFQLGNPLA